MADYTTPPRDTDEALPTYEHATTRDALPLVSRYVRRRDVYSCCLVSRYWHVVFNPVLWSAPHEFWGMGEMTEMNSFCIFMYRLSHAPPRPATTALSLAGLCRGSIYTAFPPTWLFTILHQLPHLRTLSIPAFPHLTHACRALPHPHGNLRALHIPRNANTTPELLAALLAATPGIESLDASATAGAAHTSTLAAIARLPVLRTLVLRDVALTDAGLQGVAQARGLGLRRLDVAANRLTDRAAAVLVGECCPPPAYAGGGSGAAAVGLADLCLAGNPRVGTAGVDMLVRAGCLRRLDVAATGCEPARLGGVLAVYGFATLRRLRIGWSVVRTLRTGAMEKLEDLVLVGVPAKIAEPDVGILRAFLERKGKVRLTIEIAHEGLAADDFSFFGDDEGGSAGGDFSFFREEKAKEKPKRREVLRRTKSVVDEVISLLSEELSEAHIGRVDIVRQDTTAPGSW